MNDTQKGPDRPPAVILIVEDDRSTRALLRLAMAEEGYQVVEAKDGEQGLTEYKNCRPDMVLLDAVMPGLDGFTCCRYLRDLPGGEQIPIMILTVLDDQGSVDQAFTAGATDYITKPIHWPVLAQRVRRLLAANQAMAAARQAKQQLYQQQAWMQLMRKGLARFKTGLDLRDALQATILDIHQVWGVERVVLWQRGTSQVLEASEVAMTSPLGAPESKALQPELFDLAAKSPWSRQILAGEMVEILANGDYSGSDPRQQAMVNQCLAHLKQLELQMILVAPIIVQDEIWGYLYIGDDQPLGAEEQTTLIHLGDWLKWLGILIERDQLQYRQSAIAS